MIDKKREEQSSRGKAELQSTYQKNSRLALTRVRLSGSLNCCRTEKADSSSIRKQRNRVSDICDIWENKVQAVRQPNGRINIRTRIRIWIHSRLESWVSRGETGDGRRETRPLSQIENAFLAAFSLWFRCGKPSSDKRAIYLWFCTICGGCCCCCCFHKFKFCWCWCWCGPCFN